MCVVLDNKYIQQVRDLCYGRLIFLSKTEQHVPLNFTLVVHSAKSLTTIIFTPHKTIEILFLPSHLLQDLKSASVLSHFILPDSKLTRGTSHLIVAVHD